MEKLYVVTRRDLSPGAQAVQSCHAAFQFAAEHKEIWAGWFEQSNTLALLSVSDEKTLEKLIVSAESRGLRYSVFREPDMDNALTAVTLEPAARKLCSSMSLTLEHINGRARDSQGSGPVPGGSG